MGRLIGWLAVGVVAVSLGLTARADEKDEKVPLDKVPAKVKAAVKAKYPKAEIVSAGMGDQDGVKVFEFVLKEGSRKWEAGFTPEGKFNSSEEAIKEEDLPAKVREAFKKKAPDAKVLEFERAITGEGKTEKVIYEIIIDKGKVKLELQFDPEGKLVGEEEKKK